MINLKKYGIKNLTTYIIFGQIIVFLAIKSNMITSKILLLSYTYILNGEFWRIVSYILIPSSGNIVWIMFNWYLFYLMGSHLEEVWGASTYNFFIIVNIVLTNIVGVIWGLSIGTSLYLQNAIFIAFSILNPNFTINIFLLIPIKVKYLALFSVISYLYIVIFGNHGERILAMAYLLNIAIFFYKKIFKLTKYLKDDDHEEEIIILVKPRHICEKCGITSTDYPHMDFRYCSKCNPVSCFCSDHINDHEHI